MVAGERTMEQSIYDFPAIFRRVHMEEPGEIKDEVEFLRRIWSRHLKRPVRRVLDVACGESPHGQLLADEGIAVAGVDRSASMLAEGRAQSKGKISFYRRRTIEKFILPERPFDSAILMCETFPILAANSAVLSHLNSVARHLRRGGLYVVDIDRHGRIGPVLSRRLWRRRSVSFEGAVVHVREYNQPVDWCSELQSIYELECRLTKNGREIVTRDVIPVRHWIPASLELAAMASGVFELIACYSDLSFDVPIEQCYGRWFGVLRRT